MILDRTILNSQTFDFEIMFEFDARSRSFFFQPVKTGDPQGTDSSSALSPDQSPVGTFVPVGIKRKSLADAKILQDDVVENPASRELREKMSKPECITIEIAENIADRNIADSGAAGEKTRCGMTAVRIDAVCRNVPNRSETGRFRNPSYNGRV